MRRVRRGTLQPVTLVRPTKIQFSKDFRETMQRLHVSSYSMNRARIPQPAHEEVKLSGCTAHVLGDIWNNFNSSEAVLHSLDTLNPDVVCIGSFHPASHHTYSRLNDPAVLYPKDEDLFLRTKFTNFFSKEFHNQHLYYFDKLGIFYQANSLTKICMPDTALSACYWAFENDRAKLVGAAAPPLIVQEHLAGIYTVNQLREMLEKTLEEVRNRSKALTAEVPDYDYELQERVVGIGRELYTKELLSHRTLYTASVLHKACQAFKKPVLVMDDQFVGFLKEACNLPGLPLYSDLYKPEKYGDTLESLLEKLAILTFLDDTSFNRHSKAGNCPLKLLFQGQFQRESESKALQVFNFYLQRYREMFESVYISELERLPSAYTTGRSLPRLSDSLAAIETRQGALITQAVHEEIEGGERASLLLKQIDSNIQAKLQAGISQIREIAALQEASKGEMSPINQEIIQRLMFEANAQLGLGNLPAEFEKYKKFMKWDVRVEDLLDKDVRITAYLQGDQRLPQAEGYFLDPENPPKPMTSEEQKTFNVLLTKGEGTMDIEGKSLEDLKKMGGEVIAELDGELTSQGLRIDQARERKRKLGDALTKAGLIPSEE